MNTPYIEWAKAQPPSRYNLAASGMPHVSFDDIGGTPDDMPLTGNNSYGYGPLLELIAASHGVAVDRIVTTTGCSMANYLALATLVQPGDEILIERPTYEPLLRAAAHLGAVIKRFERSARFEIDPDAVRAAITPRTRGIVVANLHNPSSAQVSDDVLRELGDAAEKVGARVIVDEVYLDAVLTDTPRSCVHLGPAFISTNSLTKVYGLAALRCGWILADADFARRAWRVADLYGNVQPFASEWLSARAFAHLPALKTRARHLLTTNGEIFNAWARTNVEHVSVPWGTTRMIRPVGVDVTALCETLRRDYDVSVVPGHFFEAPDYARVGLTAAPEIVREGLRRITECVDTLTRV